MILLIALALFGTSAVHGQTPSCKLDFRGDQYSPFYWKGYENICTKSLCDSFPWLKCDVAREYIMDQALGHYPEHILDEIKYLKKYFNTFIPQPNNQLDYSCVGACNENARQLQLERIFTNVTTVNDLGYKQSKRMMCIVIGPDIYYQQCGGKCKFGNRRSFDSYCVPDVTVSLDIWVYCPDAYPSCHKVRFDVPLSCTCKKFRCLKDLPPPKEFLPIIPPKPEGWVPDAITGPLDPWDPQGPGLDQWGPGPDQWGAGPVELGPVQIGKK